MKETIQATLNEFNIVVVALQWIFDRDDGPGDTLVVTKPRLDTRPLGHGRLLMFACDCREYRMLTKYIMIQIKNSKLKKNLYVKNINLVFQEFFKLYYNFYFFNCFRLFYRNLKPFRDFSVDRSSKNYALNRFCTDKLYNT